MIAAHDRSAPIPGSPEDVLATVERALVALDNLDSVMTAQSQRMAVITAQLEAAESRLATVVKMLSELEWVIEGEIAS